MIFDGHPLSLPAKAPETLAELVELLGELPKTMHVTMTTEPARAGAIRLSIVLSFAST